MVITVWSYSARTFSTDSFVGSAIPESVLVRLRRLGLGNPGDVKPVGQGISEMRIDYGPGYRVYYTMEGPLVLILLCGGDKKTQRRDIEQAKAITQRWRT
ncbi:MAG: type II toxin-antitoxin system RelE/ParE family toxin [Alcanivorax sp.]|nr:type II toxin-antitoxin system RelE/ParE family toxin [Alcanivorax sp.]